MYKSITVAALAAVFAFAVFSGYAGDMDGMHNEKAGKATAQVHQGRGIVNKVDMEAGIVNISHEAITSLKWPKMTMDFNVQNKSDLAAIRPGMAVGFELTLQGKGYRISRIVPAKK